MRSLTLFGECYCCGADGPVWVSPHYPTPEGSPPFPPDDDATPPLCDRCEDAQRRWDDWITCSSSSQMPSYWTIHAEGPPKSPPFRRKRKKGRSR